MIFKKQKINETSLKIARILMHLCILIKQSKQNKFFLVKNTTNNSEAGRIIQIEVFVNNWESCKRTFR